MCVVDVGVVVVVDVDIALINCDCGCDDNVIVNVVCGSHVVCVDVVAVCR